MSSPEETATAETELKFEIASASLARLKRHPALSAAGRTARLRSVYFDTPDHDLRNAGLSLRVREGDGRFVQTVKTRSGSGLIERNEWEAQVPAGRPDPLALAGTPAARVLGALSGGDLEPVFSTTVERAVRLWDDGQAVVELSLDQGEINAGSGREAIRELELELKAGTPSALFGLAEELAKTAPIRLSFDSKAERGYRLAGHDPVASLKAEQAAVTPTTSAMDAFRVVMRSCLTQVVGAAQLLRRVRSGQALHQTRVGLRRMRAALSAFEPLVADGRLAWVKAEAKWLGRQLDQARDIDVFIQGSPKPDEEGLHDDAATAAFSRRLLSAQAEAYERALEAIDSQRFADFLLGVAAWVEIGDWARVADPERTRLRETPVAVFGAAALERLHRKVRRAGRRFGRLDPEARHRLRIKAKKLRYAADLFSSSLPEHPRRRHGYIHALKRLQDCLGELNDLAVAGRLAMDVVGRRGTQTAFAAGLLVGRRRRAEPALLKQSQRAFERLLAAKPFWPSQNRRLISTP